MAAVQEQGRHVTPRQSGMLPAAIQTYGSQIGMAALSLVNALVVARSLGASARGQVVFLTAIAYLTSSLATLGVQEANVNLAGGEPVTRRSLATNSLALALALGAVAALLVIGLVALVPAAGGEGSRWLLWTVLATLPVLVLSSYLRFLIQGTYGFAVTNLAWVLPAALNVAVNLSLAAAGALTVASAVLTWLAGQLIATLLLAAYVQRRGEGFGRLDPRLAGRALAFGARSHAGRIMLLANYRMDQWILGAIAGSRQLGLYSIAVAWAEALFMLPTALAAVQRPDVVRSTDREAGRMAARLLRVSLLLTGILALALIALAPVLCVTVFGEEFRGSIEQLRILALGSFGVVALKQLGSALTGRLRPTAASLSIGSAFACTLALDFLLIPAHGGVGAAIASSAAYLFGGLVIAVVFSRALGCRMRELVPRADDARQGVALLAQVLRRRRPPVPPVDEDAGARIA
jgi:O-antigen/teichoic acid export membrane protein